MIRIVQHSPLQRYLLALRHPSFNPSIKKLISIFPSSQARQEQAAIEQQQWLQMQQAAQAAQQQQMQQQQTTEEDEYE